MTRPSAPAFPDAYLQPNPREDCGYYTAAYLARCLGAPDTTAEQVKAWRAETGRHESYYADGALGRTVRRHWEDIDDETARRRWWLGPGTEGWVRSWLDDGWIAAVTLHRISEIGHTVALLGHADAGPLLMDPIYGHMTEPWGWFLGPGSGRRDTWGSAPDGRAFHGCHFIEGWYRSPDNTPKGT